MITLHGAPVDSPVIRNGKLLDHLRCRQAVARDAGRSWIYERTPQALLRLEEAAMDAATAWHWHNRALWERTIWGVK